MESQDLSFLFGKEEKPPKEISFVDLTDNTSTSSTVTYHHVENYDSSDASMNVSRKKISEADIVVYNEKKPKTNILTDIATYGMYAYQRLEAYVIDKFPAWRMKGFRVKSEENGEIIIGHLRRPSDGATTYVKLPLEDERS